MSSWTHPGPIITFCGQFPFVYGAGVPKADGLNQALSVLGPEFGLPMQFAYWAPGTLPKLGARGCPVSTLSIGATLQPPNAYDKGPWFRNLLPLPPGRSYLP